MLNLQMFTYMRACQITHLESALQSLRETMDMVDTSVQSVEGEEASQEYMVSIPLVT